MDYGIPLFVGNELVIHYKPISKTRLSLHGGVAYRLKISSRPGGTARRPAFAENLYPMNKSEVPPSGGALNPDPHF
jgi:hypothetical protein